MHLGVQVTVQEAWVYSREISNIHQVRVSQNGQTVAKGHGEDGQGANCGFRGAGSTANSIHTGMLQEHKRFI